MTRRTRSIGIALALLAALVFCCERAGAADRTKVDEATHQVTRGARQVGEGEVGLGLREMFIGIGHTIVEGAKFSGQNVKEFFTGKKEPAPPPQS